MKQIFSRIFFLAFSFIIFSVNVKGQTIEGVVFNELKQPLPGATVNLKPHNITASTNDKGEFRFSGIPVGDIQLKITYIGYKTQIKNITITPSWHQKLNFYMKVKTTGLSEISIIGTAGRSTNTEEVSQKHLQRIQAADMKDIFSDIPSVVVGGGGANAQRIYLRGVEGSNLNITIDGAKQGRSLFQHRGNAGSIDPGLLKKVSVSTGYDATRGSGGLGGSISFETIDAQDLTYRYGKLSGKMSAGVTGASNGYVTRAIIGIKVAPRTGVLFSGSLDNQDDYRAAGFGIVPYTAAKNQNYFAKLSILDYKYHSLRLSAGYNRNSGNYISGGPGSDMGTPSDTLTAAHQVTQRETYNLDYRFVPASTLVNIKINAYYNHRNLENKTSLLDVTTDNLGTSVKNDFNFRIKKLKNTITLGADYEKEDGICASKSGTEQTNTSTVWGLFGQGLSEISFFSVSYGLRFDDYQSDFGTGMLEGNKFSPNIGVAVMPLNGLQLFANYSEAVRASGTIPIQWMSNIADTVRFNNGKPFEPETSVMQEAGVKYILQKIFTSEDKLTLSGKIFKTEMDDLIEVLEGGRQGKEITKIWNDTLGVVSKGYELLLSWQTKKLETRLSYVHADIEDETGTPVAVSRRKAAPTGDRFNWDILWKATPEIQLGYTLNAVGELKDVYETARPSYVLHNIQTIWRPQSGRDLTVSVAVNNLLNKRYSEQTSIARGNDIIPEAGRDMRVTLTYNF